MRISYFKNQTAQNSEPIWSAFLDSCRNMGIEPVENCWDSDFALIWSVLWRGRMQNNKKVYEHFRKNNKPVFIIEVGSLIRGKTWKICLNNLTKDGIYANHSNFIPNRSKKLGLELNEFRVFPHKPILIAGQHDQSLQWTFNGTNLDWIKAKIQEIRQYTSDLIHVRPHPRNFFKEYLGKNILIETPVKITGSYDLYDLKFNYKAIVNYNSGVGIQVAQQGTPLICDDSSLASEVSSTLSNLDRPTISDRYYWFEKILHTEWTIEEISQGIPLKRLLPYIGLT